MKLNKSNWKAITLVAAMFAGFFLVSCSEDEEPAAAPVASFGTEVDGLTVTFVNASVNATSYSWDFGDGNSSTDENPTHTFGADGTYTVTLTATGDGGENMASEDLEVKAPFLTNFISGKSWQLMRGNAMAIALGPQADAEVSWSYQDAPWFGLGDAESSAFCLEVRSALANDIYTFNTDGTYDVNFNGDFWAEFGIWDGELNETNLDISGGSLPPNNAGEDVNAFIAGSWDFVIDENAETLEVVGAGAHIINPRYKNEQSSHGVGEGIKYQVYKAVEGPEADTLVIYIDTYDNDFSSEPRQYMTLASYKTTAPDIRVCGGFVGVDHVDEVSASTISHTFESESGLGSGVDEIYTSSVVEYGVTMDGKVGMKYTRTDADGGFTDYKFISNDADIRFDTDGTYDYATASVEVYIPSTNDFSGALTNQVMVKVTDASFVQNFWEVWATLAETDIATDQWVTLTFDFSTVLDDANAADGIRDNIDMVILEFGGSGHGESGEIYYRDFKFIQ